MFSYQGVSGSIVLRYERLSALVPVQELLNEAERIESISYKYDNVVVVTDPRTSFGQGSFLPSFAFAISL